MMRPVKASGLIFRKTKEWAHTEQLSHHSDCNVCSVSEGSRFDSRQSLGFSAFHVPFSFWGGREWRRTPFILGQDGNDYSASRPSPPPPPPKDILCMTREHKRPYWQLNPGPSENVRCTIYMEHSLSWKAASFPDSQVIPAMLCNIRLMTVFTRLHQLCLSHATWIQLTTPHQLYCYFPIDLWHIKTVSSFHNSYAKCISGFFPSRMLYIPGHHILSSEQASRLSLFLNISVL